MKISNLKEPVCISLLKSFSEKELEGFSHFIGCSYFNTDKVIPKLFKMLRKSILKYQNFDIQEERQLYLTIFEEKLTNNELNARQKSKLNSKYNALTRLAERFLYVNAIEEDTASKNKLLFQELLGKKQYGLFNRHANKEQKRLAKEKIKDLDFHNQAVVIEQALLEYAHQISNVGKVDNLEDLNYQLDVQFILRKFSLYITMLANESIAEKNYNKASMNVIFNLLNLDPYKEHSLISLNHSTVNLIIKKNNKAFEEQLTLLDKLGNQITSESLNAYYQACINYCIQQLRKGENMYKSILNIYQIMHKKKLLLEGNIFPESKLKNIIAVCCRVGEFEWAKEIINEYQNYVRRPVRDNVFHFNIGMLAFYERDYNLALHHFIRVEPININYDVNCRILLLKSHYEVDEDYDERTVQIFRSAEKFFYENKALTSYSKKGHRNFIRTLINLYRIKHFATKMTKERLKEKLELQDINVDKNWLLTKIEEL